MKKQNTNATGNSGSILRLVLLALSLAIGIIAGFSELFNDNIDGFLRRISVGIGDIGAMMLVAIYFCLSGKLFRLVGSHSLSWAGAFWDTFLPLNLYTLAIKVCLWLAIVIMPFTLGMGALLMPVFFLVLFMAKMSANLLVMLLITAATLALTAWLARKDLQKLQLIPV